MRETGSYWSRYSEIGRRNFLRAAAASTAALAAIGLAGCGSSSSKGGGEKGSSLIFTPSDSSARAVKGGVLSVSQTNDIMSFDASSNASDATQSFLSYSRFIR